MTAVEALSKIKSRGYTPAQRSISAKHKIRSKSKSRLEGQEPPRVIPVPEEQIRLAKKINKKAFGRDVKVHEADRHIAVKKPKWLMAGKMSNGSRNKR